MMKKYFLQTAALIALLCGAASCSNDDNEGNGDTPPPTSGAVTYAECNYYGDVQNATKYTLLMLTTPVDNSGNPTNAGSKYYIELYSSKVTGANPLPAAGTYQFDAQSAQKSGSFASNGSYMIPVVMSGGSPKNGEKVNFKAGSLTVSADGNNIKVEGSLTLTTGKEIELSAANFKYIDKSEGNTPDPEPEYTGLLQEDIDMGSLSKAAAIYYGDAFGKGNTNYAILLANAEGNKFISVEVMGAATASIDVAAVPTGTFEIAFDASTDSAVAGMVDSQNNLFGTFYADLTESTKPIFGLADSGTATISKSGSNYTVVVDVLTEDGYSIKGSYTGSLTLNEPESNAQTTLTDDLALDFTGITGAQAIFSGKANGVATGVWFVVLEQDAPNTDWLCIQIFTESAEYTTTFPAGTYTCAETGAASTFVGGMMEQSGNQIQLYGSYYYKINDKNELLEFAPAADGTFKIEKAGNNYKFTTDIVDDGGNKITGTWTGPAVTVDGTAKSSAKSVKTRLSSLKMNYSNQFISDYTGSRKLISLSKRASKIQLPVSK